MQTKTTTTVTSSFSLVQIPIAIGAFYMLCCFLNLIMIILVTVFDNQISKKYSVIPYYKKVLGKFLKILPPLIRFFHYLIFLLITGQWVGLFLSTSCKNAYHETLTKKIQGY